MSDLVPLLPRQPFPALAVPTVDGPVWRLSEQRPERFTMIAVYRGRHCPQCRNSLLDLASKRAAFAERGVEVVALSTDGEERARSAVEDWKLTGLTVGYGLELAMARRLGLYVSRGRGATSIGVEEPELFAEPGLFLVRPDGTLYWAAVQTMPFARPRYDDVLTALDFVIAKDYPARGEVVVPPEAAQAS